MCCVSHTYIYAWCISCGVYLIHISCMVYLMCCVSHTYIYAWCISCVVYLIHTSMHGVSHVVCISYIFLAWCISCVVYLIHTSMHGVSHVVCISYIFHARCISCVVYLIHLCMVYLMCYSRTSCPPWRSGLLARRRNFRNTDIFLQNVAPRPPPFTTSSRRKTISLLRWVFLIIILVQDEVCDNVFLCPQVTGNNESQ